MLGSRPRGARPFPPRLPHPLPERSVSPFFSRPSAQVGLAALALSLSALTPRLAQAQGEAYGPEDLTSAPRLVSPAAAARLIVRSFPDELRRQSVGGTVQLQFVIAPNGKVEANSVEVVTAANPALGAAAKSVAEKLEFVPGKKDGGAVRARVLMPITYKP